MAPTTLGRSGMISASRVGRDARSSTSCLKVVRILRMWRVIRIRPLDFRMSGTWRMQNSPLDPETPGLTNRSSPRSFCHWRKVTRFLVRMDASSFKIRCCLLSGSSRVCFMASTSQPRMILAVVKEPSPRTSFLSEMGSVAPGRSAGDLSTSSMAFITILRTVFSR